jgi:hypothetical protein
MKKGKKRQSTKPTMFRAYFRVGSKSERALVSLMETLSDEEWHDRHALVAAVATETRLEPKTVSNLLHSLNGYGAVRRRGGYGMTRRRNGSLHQLGSRAPIQVAITPLGRACWDREAKRFDTDRSVSISPETRNGTEPKAVTETPGHRRGPDRPMGEHYVTPRTDGEAPPDGSASPHCGECDGCSMEFIASRRDQRYCSQACRQRAYRRRQRQRNGKGAGHHPVPSSAPRYRLAHPSGGSFTAVSATRE